MGLLDDAIREHLELKRQHGADPDEVAQQERLALAPLDADGPPAIESPVDDDEGAIAHDVASPGAEERSGPDSSDAIQETAEIDMRTVLGSADVDGEEPLEMPHPKPREARARSAAARIDQPSSTPGIEADPLGWEVPATRSRLFKRRSARSRTSSGDLPAEGSLP
jgi:hypothetical protein